MSVSITPTKQVKCDEPHPLLFDKKKGYSIGINYSQFLHMTEDEKPTSTLYPDLILIFLLVFASANSLAGVVGILCCVQRLELVLP